MNKHYILINLNKLKSLIRFKVNNKINNEENCIDFECAIELGKNFNISFLENDIFQIVSKDVDIRIDVDLDSIERAIVKFRADKYD